MDASRKNEALRLVRDLASAGNALARLAQEVGPTLDILEREGIDKEAAQVFRNSTEKAEWMTGWAGPDTEAHRYLEQIGDAVHRIEMALQRIGWSLQSMGHQWERADQTARFDAAREAAR